MVNPGCTLWGALRAASIAGAVAVMGMAPFVAAVPARAETALAPEKNPPGDIPDSQVFISYENAAGYALKVPEGWARTESGAEVRFQDKLDAVSVTLSAEAEAPTVDQAKTIYVPALEKAGRAVKIGNVSLAKLPSGAAILISYSANSDPNPVTGKQVRLEANRYLIFRSGKLAALDMSAPYGADNVDQWDVMARSFRWK